MKTRIVLTDWYNVGILATWHTGTVKNTAVFDTREAVDNYFIGLYWQPVIVDRRRTA